MRRVAVLAAALLIGGALPGVRLATASDGGPHPGTFRTWAVGADPVIGGFDPHETVDDVTALTGHVGTPSMVTSMENTQFGFCGLLFWNPDTNAFKSYGVTGGFQFALDVNRAAASGAPMVFGGGDSWTTVNGNPSFSPYMNFPGSDDFRRWDVGAFAATGIRVNSSNGKVYFGNHSPAEIIELDPATNVVRKWATGNNPYFLELDSSGRVYATAFAGGGFLDQILRLDPATDEIRRWDVPGGGFQPFVSFGTPNFITEDLEGKLWFTESGSDELGRLDPVADTIEEFSKPGFVDNPHAIASSGSGPTLQSFFTEASPSGGEHVSVLTRSAATPVTTAVAPAAAIVAPATSTASFIDFVVTPVTATIPPVDTAVASSDPSGIDQFPIPAGTSEPTGMTRVAFPQTVFGSMEGSDHVFRLVSEVIVAPPGDEICGDGIDNDGDGLVDEDCPPPPSEEGRMTGGGSVATGTAGVPPGVRVTHGFELNCDEADAPNNLQVNWAGNRFHLEALTSASCSDDASIAPDPPPAGFDTYVGEGAGRCNGLPAVAKWTFTDAGEPGGGDTAKIEISGGCSLTVSGSLKNGNHQAHAA